MEYRLPELKDEKILKEYINEHYNYNEKNITASMELEFCNYTEWIKKIYNNALIGDNSWGKSILYLCFSDSKLIGLLNIRYELSNSLANKYGHIGYGVRPSERNKGYATTMLKYALEVCKEKAMKEVILGCYKSNIASAKTIVNNNGILIRECDNYKKGITSQYYTIEV